MHKQGVSSGNLVPVLWKTDLEKGVVTSNLDVRVPHLFLQ
jgi:hypothetical protein